MLFTKKAAQCYCTALLADYSPFHLLAVLQFILQWTSEIVFGVWHDGYIVSIRINCNYYYHHGIIVK